MKKILILLCLAMAVTVTVAAPVDTLYYDKDWKASDRNFASFYRVYTIADDSCSIKRYRDFFITGEIQAEGYYISIDSLDDSKSKFEGENCSYFKSGRLEQKANYQDGRLMGEYTRYKENGQMAVHAYFMNDSLHGVYTEFVDGGICYQTEFVDGKRNPDYYILSDDEGYCSKMSVKDDKPIYESPELNEKKSEYRNGDKWYYYNKNGIMLGAFCKRVKDYGKFYQLSVSVVNNSLFPIDFDPEQITANIITRKGETEELKVYSSEEYLKKVKRQQNWALALGALCEGVASAGAGYSTSYTSSYNSGTTYDYSGGYSNMGTYSSYGSSVTTTYDPAAAYQAQVVADNRIASYSDKMLSEREAKEVGYLKITTVHPGEVITGYINIERIKGTLLNVTIDINGAKHIYSWNVEKE